MMALYRALGPVTTIEPGQTLTFAWRYSDNQDHGPNYISANFVSRWNAPQVATIQTSLQSLEGHEFVYFGQLRCIGEVPASIQFDVGNFE
jgi:hypothetical protein